MPPLLLLLPSCDAGLLFKHASVPQVVSSVKAEYPPVGNYHFNAYLSLIEKRTRRWLVGGHTWGHGCLLNLFILKVGNAPLCDETKAWQVARPLRHAPGLPPRSRCFARIESSFGLLCLLESKGALWKVAVASDMGFGIRRHRLAPTSVLV